MRKIGEKISEGNLGEPVFAGKFFTDNRRVTTAPAPKAPTRDSLIHEIENTGSPLSSPLPLLSLSTIFAFLYLSISLLFFYSFFSLSFSHLCRSYLDISISAVASANTHSLPPSLALTLSLSFCARPGSGKLTWFRAAF